MNKNEQRQRDYQNEALRTMGFDFDEIDALRRISRTLERWAVAECNGEIERDEQTGKPFRVWDTPTGAKYPAPGPYYKRHRYAISDRETGATNRAKKIMEAHPDLWIYFQGDPRGAMIYVGRYDERTPKGKDLGCCYTNGIAIY